MAPAARDYAMAVATVSVPVVASPATHWHDELTTLMGPTVDVPATIAAWVAGGLSENKLRSAMRGTVDKKLVFQRLLDANKGIYQQRVVVDDYDNIPGTLNKQYVNNSLPKTEILASSFGITDPRFNLPVERAVTFAGQAELREVEPGLKLYRVANVPITDPRGKTGGYWTRTPPAQLADLVGGTAVMPEWDNFQRVYEFTAPPYADPINKEPKFMVWEGPAASQPVSYDYKEKLDNGYCLPGGAQQVFINNHLAWAKEFPTYITDVTSTHKKW